MVKNRGGEKGSSPLLEETPPSCTPHRGPVSLLAGRRVLRKGSKEDTHRPTTTWRCLAETNASPFLLITQNLKTAQPQQPEARMWTHFWKYTEAIGCGEVPSHREADSPEVTSLLSRGPLFISCLWQVRGLSLWRGGAAGEHQASDRRQVALRWFALNNRALHTDVFVYLPTCLFGLGFIAES